MPLADFATDVTNYEAGHFVALGDAVADLTAPPTKLAVDPKYKRSPSYGQFVRSESVPADSRADLAAPSPTTPSPTPRASEVTRCAAVAVAC